MGPPIRTPSLQALVDAASPSPVALPADGLAAFGEFAVGAPALAAGALALLLTAPRALGAARRAPFAILAWVVALAVLTFAAAERLGRAPATDDVAAHTAWTAAAPDGPRAALAAAAAAGGAGFTVAAAGGEAVSRSVAVAAARAARADAVSLIWSGPFDVAGVLAPVSAGLAAHTVRPPTPVDPARLGLRAVRAPLAGRPAAVELRVAPPESPVGRDVATAIAVRIGAERFAVEVPPFRDDAPFTTELGWLPAGAGSLDVEVVWSGPEPWRAIARGVIDVAAPRDDVLVAGAGAAEFVAALAVQGIGAGVIAESTDDELDPATTLVLLDAPAPSLAARIPDFVDAGGGLVLAGAGLPAADAPLAALSPLVALPRPAAAPTDGAGDGPPTPDAVDGDTRADGVPAPVGPPAPPAAGADPDAGPPDRPEPSGRPEPAAPPLPDERAALAGDVSTADPSSGVERAAVERRRIAMALVIDRSGSMIGLAGRGATRMQLAKRSAKDTALALEAGDELGIVAFGVGASAVRELGPLPGAAELERRLAELRATDSRTQLAAGVQEGLKMLRGTEAPVRSLVVITDADSLDPVEVARAHAAAIEAREVGITVSLIVITNSVRVADIKAIATDGGGAFALSVDGADLPRLVMTEVRRAQRAAGRRVVDDAAQRPGRDPAPGGPVSERAPDRAVDEAADEVPRVDPADTDDRPTDVEDAAANDADGAAAPIGPEAPPGLGAGADDRPVAPTAAVPVFPVEPSPLVDPWAEDRFPPLVREPFVRHQPRALVLLATGAGNPVLAVRPFGLGRVAAFAPEWLGDDLVAWRADARLPAWLATWVRAVEPTLVAPPPADALVDRSVEPPAPTAAEVRALERVAVGPLRPLAAWVPPEPQTVDRARPRGHDDALWALLALLLLAVSERLSRLP